MSIFQQRIDRTAIRIRILLTNKQVHILRCFYANQNKNVYIEEVGKFLKYKIAINTVRSTVQKLLRNGLIERKRLRADKRYKFFQITLEGIDEYENQLKLRKRGLEW